MSEQIQQSNPYQLWENEVSALCNRIFFNTPDGIKLLQLWESRYFYAPVVDPSKDVAWGYSNEGRNNFIRGIRAAAYQAMNGEAKVTQLQKDPEHEREDV